MIASIAITVLECALAGVFFAGVVVFVVIAAPVVLYEKAVRKPVQA